MIKEEFISDLLNTAKLEEVAIDICSLNLKKSGSNYKCKSPFVDEKSASFFISPTKNIFKCFSSGTSGFGAIQLIQKVSKLTFPDAVKKLADYYNLAVEYVNEDKELSAEKREKKEMYGEVLNIATPYFNRALTDRIKKHYYDRALTDDDINAWELSYGSESNDLVKELNKSSLFYAAAELGITAGNEKRTWNKMAKRLIIPIRDAAGRLKGYASRDISGRKKSPKYMNPAEDPAGFYRKNYLLYGLYKAIKSIKEKGCANLVEGYFDVISAHRCGVENTVAACGTSVTEGQLRLLFKYTDELNVIMDGDAAGVKAAKRVIPMALTVGFKVRITSMNQDSDIDDYLRDKTAENLNEVSEYLENRTIDACLWITYMLHKEEIKFSEHMEILMENFNSISDASKRERCVIDFLEYKALNSKNIWLIDLWEFNDLDLTEKSKNIGALLNLINDPITVEKYVAYFSKVLGVTKKSVQDVLKLNDKQAKETKRKVNSVSSGYDFEKVPDGVDKEFLSSYGFYEDGGNYWFFDFNKNAFVPANNFSVTPLYHVVSEIEGENLRVMLFNRGGHSVPMIMDSACLVSFTEFKKVLSRKRGGYRFNAYSRILHFEQFIDFMNDQFEEAFPMHLLGMKPEGFWAFSNAIVTSDGKVHNIDEYGVIKTHVKFKSLMGKYVDENRNYFLPAFSSLMDNVSEAEDPYETQRKLVYIESPVQLDQWLTTLVDAFGKDKSMIAIAFLFSSFFRSIIYSRLNYFPLMYMYGEKGSGKSLLTDLLINFSGCGQQAFQLSSGTEVGFIRKVQQVIDGLVAYNEMGPSIANNRFNFIKGLFDGIGREKGSGVNSFKNAVDKVQSSVILIGQYLMSIDDHAITERCIIQEFNKPEKGWETDKINAVKKLEQWKEHGISSLVVDVMKHREHIKNNVLTQRAEVALQLKNDFKLNDERYSGRVLNNWSILLSVIKLLELKLKLPFTYDEFYGVAKAKILETSDIIGNSEGVSKFWTDLQLLSQSGDLVHNQDYEWVNKSSLSIRESRRKFTTWHNKGGAEILLLKWKIAYAKYSNFSKEPIEKNTLSSYFKNRKEFIGYIDNYSFNGKERAGAMAFNYDLLQKDPHMVTLYRNNYNGKGPELPEETPEGLPLTHNSNTNQLGLDQSPF